MIGLEPIYADVIVACVRYVPGQVLTCTRRPAPRSRETEHGWCPLPSCLNRPSVWPLRTTCMASISAAWKWRKSMSLAVGSSGHKVEVIRIDFLIQTHVFSKEVDGDIIKTRLPGGHFLSLHLAFADCMYWTVYTYIFYYWWLVWKVLSETLLKTLTYIYLNFLHNVGHKLKRS